MDDDTRSELRRLRKDLYLHNEKIDTLFHQLYIERQRIDTAIEDIGDLVERSKTHEDGS
jgi:hypothetical protein